MTSGWRLVKFPVHGLDPQADPLEEPLVALPMGVWRSALILFLLHHLHPCVYDLLTSGEA